MAGGKKKGGKKGGKSKKSSAATNLPLSSIDPLANSEIDIPPPPIQGEELIKLLTTHPVEGRDLYGMKISTRALEKLTPQEISDLKMVFEAFDYRNVGFIGVVDVRRALRALGFQYPHMKYRVETIDYKTHRLSQISKEKAKHMVKETGLKGDGIVDFNEFLDLVISQQGESRDVYGEILHGFKMFDFDDCGLISMANLKRACQEVGLKFSKDELQAMMVEADLNGDGLVDHDEFIKIMLQTNLF